MIVVTDNGPVGHLVQIGCIELLSQLYGQVLIPPAVIEELLHPSTPEKVRSWTGSPPTWVQIIAPQGLPDRRRPGAGEREAIRLAKELEAQLLCDDAKAKARARREGLLVTGTLGVLQQAHIEGRVEIEEEIERLRTLTTMRLPEDGLANIVAYAVRARTEWLTSSHD